MRVNRTATKEKRQYTIDGFGGVDFSASPLTVSPHRSPNAINWIGDHGINRKRHGWRQICDSLPGKINGIFPIDADGDNLLIYAVNRFYRAEKDAEGAWSVSDCNTAGDVGLLVNRRVQAFTAAEGLYIVGAGRYLIYTKEDNTVRPVTPFIPTTTININREEDGEEADQRAVLDLVNLLTPRRRNTLVGAAAESTWKLDDYISSAYKTVVEVEKNDGTIETYSTVLNAPNSYANGLFKDGSLNDSAVGTVDYGKKTVTLNFDTSHQNDGYANITVTFTPHTYSKKFDEQIINSATHGTLFGIGGARDRLFVSGNPSYKGVVFFSEADDFTYFPDQYTISVGNDAQPITGFLQLSDNTLAVSKERGANEGTVHYISGEYRFNYNESGEVDNAVPIFTVTAGAGAESALNPYTCLSFAGDNLIVSNHGVFGIEPASNVLTDTRLLRERSFAISPALHSLKADNAVGIVHDGRCYISNGAECFVADSAYTYTPEGSSFFNYEWWYWEHIPAHVFASVKDELWFGTRDGRICAFYDGYEDITYDDTGVGTLGLEVNNGAATGSLLYSNDDLDGLLYVGLRLRLSLSGGSIYARCAQMFDDIYEGEEIYLSENGILVPYKVLEVDRSAGKFKLEGGNWFSPTEDAYYRRIDGRDVFIKTIYTDSNTFSVSLTPEGEHVIVSNVEGGTNPVARLYTDTPVRAYWETPDIAIGGETYEKTLFALTLTAESGRGGEVRCGYKTRALSAEKQLHLPKSFSFEDFDFSAFSFENGFQVSHTMRARARNFNFIRFRFESATPTPCAVHSICARYKINKYTKGVS